MQHINLSLFTSLFVLYSSFVHSYEGKFDDSKYNICFTPGEECTDLIVNTLNKAKKSIKIQAYSFTSAPIAKAVVNAQERGVDVKVILDKSQFSDKFSASKFLLNHKVDVWQDSRVAIAHNKVMIVDEKTVITGSFNFTKAAQERNAENLLIISDPILAKKYLENWQKRMSFSNFIPKQ